MEFLFHTHKAMRLPFCINYVLRTTSSRRRPRAAIHCCKQLLKFSVTSESFLVEFCLLIGEKQLSVHQWLLVGACAPLP